jgi:uroporphyrinogen III methyltransferase / synthase
VTSGSKREYENLEDVDIILFTSPSTVKNTIDMFGEDAIKDKRIVSIGPITEEELKKRNIESVVSETYTVDGMIEALVTM